MHDLRLHIGTAHPVSALAHRCAPPRCVREDFDAQLLPNVDLTSFRLGSVERADVPACVDVLMDGFYKDILTLAKDEFSEEEMEQLRPVLTALNGVFASLTRANLFLDAGRRLSPRLDDGGLQRGNPKDALMLALQERATGTIVGVAELSQQPRDGKVPGDFRLPLQLPWARSPDGTSLGAPVAYVCNLAVRSQWRSRGHGTALVQACEATARAWGFNEVYLHAATKDTKLLDMYRGMDYRALPIFDQPKWVLALAGREATRYHCKSLGMKSSTVPQGAG